MKYALTACLGGGVIGASLTALFLASGDFYPDFQLYIQTLFLVLSVQNLDYQDTQSFLSLEV